MKKNLSLLKLLFAAFFVLHLAGVKPFADWSLWLIFAVLLLHYVSAFISRLITETGLDTLFWGEVALMSYDIIAKKEMRKSIRENKKKIKDGTFEQNGTN